MNIGPSTHAEQCRSLFDTWKRALSGGKEDLPAEALYRVMALPLSAAVSGTPAPGPVRSRPSRRGEHPLMQRIAWTALWTVKWWWWNIRHRSVPVLLASFLVDRRTGLAYLEMLRQTAAHRGAHIVHSEIIARWDMLFARDVLCAPFGLWTIIDDIPAAERERVREKQEQELNRVFTEKFPEHPVALTIPPYVHTFLLRRFRWNRRLVTDLAGRHEVLALIQDIDFTGERLLLAQECRDRSIPTVCCDHAVLFHTPWFRSFTSGHHLVWGEHERLRLLAAGIEPSKIDIIGPPLRTVRTMTRRVPKRSVWVYFLSGMSDPLVPIPERSPDLSITYIRAIRRCIDERFPGTTFLIKPHPSDDPDIFRGNGAELTDEPVQDLAATATLTFCEDSTAAIELLHHDTPVVYLADQAGHCHLDDVVQCAFGIASGPGDLAGTVTAVLSSELRRDLRTRAAEHYMDERYDPSMRFQDRLNRAIQRREEA